MECSESDYRKETCSSAMCIIRVRYKQTNKTPADDFL